MFPSRIISYWNDIVGLVKNSNLVDSFEVQICGSGCRKRETVPEKVKLEAHSSINDAENSTRYTHKVHRRCAI